MSAPTKNIVFDWNSTLLDDIGALFDCQNILMRSMGKPPITIDYFRAHYDVPFERLYTNLGLTDAEIEKAMGLDKSIFHDHYEPMANVAGLREGAVEVLGHAQKHGVKSLILSNHIVDPIRTQLRRLEIEHLFAEVLAYATRKVQFRDMSKGERLRRFMQQNGMAPHQTIIVGDSVEEIEIAREQGLISVAITGGCVSEERLRAANPDHIIHSLHALKPIMQERGFVS